MAETLQNKAALNLARAKNTKAGDGTEADPKILDHLWSQIARQPGGMQTLANPDMALHVWKQAVADTMLSRRGAVPKPSAPIPAPLHTETPGGGPSELPKLSAADKRAARDLEMSEADYAKVLATRPANWGKR